MTETMLPARRLTLSLLENDTAFLTLVAAEDIHPQTTPANPHWPFVRYGGPSEVPLRAACMSGSEISVSVHGFSKALYDGSGAMIETAEDRAIKIGEGVKAALDRRKVTVGGVRIGIRWVGSNTTPDGAEADAFHTQQQFRIRVIGGN